jgi:hypothetical protein
MLGACKKKHAHPKRVGTPSFFFQEKAPQWMFDQIKEDLAPFVEKGITKESLDATMQQEISHQFSWAIIRYQITGNRLHVIPTGSPHVAARSAIVTAALEKLLQSVRIPDVDFLVSLHDSIDDANPAAPLFAFAKNPKRTTQVILMPDFEALAGYSELLSTLQKTKKKLSWDQKIAKAVWRGSRTGGHFTLENFFEYPRSQAVSLSLKHPDWIDARFSLHCQEGGDLLEHFPEYFGSALSLRKQLRYKYQLLIDGNSCAYSGAYWRWLSGSVVFKQASDSIQWYYRCLQPYIHYIPIKSDLSDLIDKLSWANQHDEEVHRISQHAYEFASTNLDHSHTMQYLYLLLVEYSKLQRT